MFSSNTLMWGSGWSGECMCVPMSKAWIWVWILHLLFSTSHVSCQSLSFLA
jgi:hypothetical protein